MITNRIRPFAAAPEEEPAYGDFVVVSGPFGSACVCASTARAIERVLDRRWRPRWLVFRDRAGSRWRVRTGEVRLLVESTVAQRAADRDLERARRQEERQDRRPWEEDA